MSIQVRCGQCGKQYAAPDALAGKRARCLQCGAEVEIPTPISELEPASPVTDLPEQELGAGLTTPDPLADPFAPAPAPATPLSPRRRLPPRKPKKSAEPSIGSMLMAFVRAQKLLTGVILGMAWVMLWQLYGLVAVGLGPGLVVGAILLVIGVVIVIGGLRLGSARRDRSTDKARATRSVGWFIVGIVGIGGTFFTMLMVAKMGAHIPTVTNLAGPFLVVFGLIVLVSGLLLAYYVLVLLFPKTNIFRILGWFYVGLTLVIPALALTVGALVAVGDATSRRARQRDVGESEEWASQVSKQESLVPPPGFPGPTGPGGLPSEPGALPGSEEELDRVLNELRSGQGNFGKCYPALLALNRMEPIERRRDEVADVLEPMLSGSDASVRRFALQAVALWGTRRNVPTLLALLDDPDTGLRRLAMEALAKIEPAKAAEAIAQRVPDTRDGITATHVLERMGPAAEDAVIKLLAHEDSQVRFRACSILERISGEKSVAALNKLLETETDPLVRITAEKVLRRLTGQA
jgi:hypothetical protein